MELADVACIFLDAPTEMIPAALSMLCEDLNHKTLDVTAKQRPILTAVSPPYMLQKFHSSEYITHGNGEHLRAFGWSERHPCNST